MASIARSNPAATTTNVEMMGGNMTFFTVDYVNANASTGPAGAQQAALKALQGEANIVAIGPMLDTNSQQTFAAEGWHASSAARLQAAVRALGTVDSVNLGSTTVTETKLGILTAAAVS